MQDGLLLVGGTLCQCVNDPGEDDWCWLLVVAGGVPEPSSPRGRGLPALRVVVTLFSVHPPATLAEINDNGNTAAVGAPDNYPGPSVRIRTCHEPSCPRGGGIYSVQCQYDQ